MSLIFPMKGSNNTLVVEVRFDVIGAWCIESMGFCLLSLLIAPSYQKLMFLSLP